MAIIQIQQLSDGGNNGGIVLLFNRNRDRTDLILVQQAMACSYTLNSIQAILHLWQFAAGDKK